MPFDITIKPSGHSFACDDGETVLAAAMRADLMIPYGCRNGACGTCKGKILEGRVDYGMYQSLTLTDEEKAAGLALFCCAKPESDLVIEVREVRRAEHGVAFGALERMVARLYGNLVRHRQVLARRPAAA